MKFLPFLYEDSVIIDHNYRLISHSSTRLEPVVMDAGVLPNVCYGMRKTNENDLKFENLRIREVESHEFRDTQ